MKLFYFFLFFTVILLPGSCDFKAEVKPGSSEKNETKVSTSKIRNDIELKTKGIKVSQAFLLYDDGSLVPETNVAKVNQRITLRLILEEGWKEENGKVEIGASEKITTNTGEILVDEPDLFANTGQVNAEDARAITLYAVITRLDKLYDYFLVSFRVWDKKGDAEVTGSYKLYIQ